METFSDRFRSYFMEAYEREAAPSWDLSSASIEEALSRVDSPARAHALAVLFPLQIMQITAGISMPEGITLERSPEEVAAFINQVLEEIRPNSGREALAERLTIKRPILLRIADEVRRAHFDLGVLSSDTMLRLGADISNRGASSARVWVKNAEKRLVVLEAVARLAHSYADMDFLQSPTNGMVAKFARYVGRASHAGGAPQRGINALYAAHVALVPGLAHAFGDGVGHLRDVAVGGIVEHEDAGHGGVLSAVARR